MELFETLKPKLAGFIIGQEECPETHRAHLQGWLEFFKKGRPMTELKLPRTIHWEKAKGTPRENYEYCGKDGAFVAWGTGDKAKPYKVTIDLYPWELQLVDFLIKTEADDRTIYWIWEPSGCAGKTTFQKYLITFYTDRRIIVLSGKAADMKNAIVDYQKTNGALPEIILVNVLRSVDQQFVSFQGLEEIKDMLFYSGKYEGGMVCGPSAHLCIFANTPPALDKFSADRWKVFEISDSLLGKQLVPTAAGD